MSPRNLQEPIFDIRSTAITHYRTYQMTQSGIRYVNPIRSVRMRAAQSMQSLTQAYLMRNDAIISSGSAQGWIESQWANISAPDTVSNTIEISTDKKAFGYIAAKYIRVPNASDLVRIGQADPVYWSDIAHVNVAHLVNVRAHPWYGAKILHVVTNKTPLYVISTVDNWSEVVSEDKTIRGYIRSDYLIVDIAQRVDR